MTIKTKNASDAGLQSDVTHLSVTFPSNCRPGRISRSGTLVSTMVETIAIQTFCAATLWAEETAAM